MFSRISSAIAFFFIAFAVSAAATTITVTKTLPPAPTATPYPPASSCNTGDLQCCNSVEAANSGPLSIVYALLISLGLAVAPIDALIGVTCSPIDIFGIGSGGQCTAQPVCCENNDFNGIIALGCNPINIGL